MIEIIEGYAKKLSLAFEKDKDSITQRQFELNQPTTATMKTRTGQYRKHPLIGGENFRASSAYVGKTGKLIIVFTPADLHLASKYGFMEMPAEQARNMLRGFTEHMDFLLAVDFDEQVSRFKDEAMAEEREAYFAAKQDHYAESFGSW